MPAEFPKFDPIPLDFDESEVPLCRWDDGTVRVRGHRLLLEMVINEHVAGRTAKQIADDFAPLTRADAEAIVAFYLREQPAVDAYVEEVNRQAAAIRAAVEAELDGHGLKKRILARKRRRDAAAAG